MTGRAPRFFTIPLPAASLRQPVFGKGAQCLECSQDLLLREVVVRSIGVNDYSVCQPPGSGQVPSHTRPSRGKLLMLIPRIGWWCVCVGPLLVKQQPARQGGVTCVVLAGSSRKPPGLRLATTQVRSPEPCSGDQADLTIDRKGSLVWDIQWESTHRTTQPGFPRRGQNANPRWGLKHERGGACLLKCEKRPFSSRTDVVCVKLTTQQPTNGRPPQPLSYLRHHALDSGLIRGETACHGWEPEHPVGWRVPWAAPPRGR